MKSLLFRQDIEKAKGLAILLVVFGHIVARADPAHVAWYEPVRRAIYTFHMPFFLYLSGFVAVLSGAVFTAPGKWLDLFQARARRLLVPFMALGALIVFGKAIAGHFVFVDNPPASLAAGLGDLLWHTADSSALSIWYLFVLFVVSSVTPVLVWADHGRLRVVMVAALLIYCLPLPKYVYLDHIGKYAIFFVLGAVAAKWGQSWLGFCDRYWRVLFVLLLGSATVTGCFGAAWPVKVTLLSIGMISMPALHGLVRHSGLFFAPILLWLGRNSFMIYLFNTICIGLAKGVMLRVTDWDGSHFLPFAILLMLSGSLGPVLLNRTVFQRFKSIGGHKA